MTPTAVSSSGLALVGALTAARAKPVPATTDGFAQIFGDMNGGEVVSVGIGESAAAAGPDPLAVWDLTESVQGRYVVVTEMTVAVDAVTPLDSWHPLAMAWSDATLGPTPVVADEGEGEPEAAPLDTTSESMPSDAGAEPADGAPRGAARPHAVHDVSVQTARVTSLIEPAHGPVPDAMPGALDAGGGGGLHMDVPHVQARPTDSRPTVAPMTEVRPTDARELEPVSPEAPQGNAVERLVGMTAADKPSRDMTAESPRSHDRPPPSGTGMASPAPDGGQEAAATVATAATVAPVSTDRVDETRGSRQSDRAPSLPDALAAVGVQPTVRAATNIGFDPGLESASPPTSDTAAAVVDQVVKSMRLQWKNGLGEARIQLRPEHLGPVEISIKVDGGSITAVVRAESSQVQDWILSHQHSLRQQLEAAGLRLDDLVVTPDAERRRQGEHADEKQQTAARRRRADGSAPTFEVIV